MSQEPWREPGWAKGQTSGCRPPRPSARVGFRWVGWVLSTTEENTRLKHNTSWQEALHVMGAPVSSTLDRPVSVLFQGTVRDMRPRACPRTLASAATAPCSSATL